MLTLISATPSPYARKNRIALLEESIPFSLRSEIPWESGTETPQHNPLEKAARLALRRRRGARVRVLAHKGVHRGEVRGAGPAVDAGGGGRRAEGAAGAGGGGWGVRCHGMYGDSCSSFLAF